MGTDEMNLVRKLTKAVALLSDSKREYIIGYAEGVLAMAAEVRAERTQDSA